MQNTEVRQKPSQGKKSRPRWSRRENRSLNAWCINKNRRADIDAASGRRVHMNGRIYDPELGRFLSPDPTVPDPGNTQAYNRYSYVFNNPLSFTDPSGFAPKQEEMTQEEWEEMWEKMTPQEKKEAQKARSEGRPVGYRSEVTDSLEGRNVDQNQTQGSDKPNYVITYGEQGSSDDPVYNQTVTVEDGDGNTLGEFEGSSTPNPNLPRNASVTGENAYPYVQGGVYRAEHGKHKGKAALIVNEDGSVPTTKTNPRHEEQGRTAKYIRLHKGSTPTWKGSAGCFTVHPDQWEQFMSVVPAGSGLIYVPPPNNGWE